jgi:hypothetical protein
MAGMGLGSVVAFFKMRSKACVRNTTCGLEMRLKLNTCTFLECKG